MLEVKDYSKQELADAIYANNIKPESRLHKLWREISRCPELVEDLRRLHSHTGDSGYTAQMVERIKYNLCIDWKCVKYELFCLLCRQWLILRTKRLHECCIFVTGKQAKLLGWHLRLVETSRTNRSDYSFTPIGIIRTPCRNYPDRSLRLYRRPTDASTEKKQFLHF